jgi:large subunit ribosomal protein L10
MALSKDKKNEIYADVSQILNDSKLTVVAKYTGTPVKTLQSLRKSAKESTTSVKVYKNRIVIKALQSNPKFKDIDTSLFTGMLIYASNPIDELTSAKVVAQFSKLEPTIEIIGAITSDGTFLSTSDTNALASIPPLEVLRAHLLGTLSAPFSGFVNVVSGNIRGLVNVLNAHLDQVK